VRAAINLCAQAAIDVEMERLRSVRVRGDSSLAQEAASISGQQVPQAVTLEELLRRPHVHYRSLRHTLVPSSFLKLLPCQLVVGGSLCGISHATCLLLAP
jgi:tRNA U34 5-carboxymethylaminomethyl modifying enzyme MnmG/GidA